MTSEDCMEFDQRHAYLRGLKSQYDQANRSEKNVLLDLAECQTGLHPCARSRCVPQAGFCAAAKRRCNLANATSRKQGLQAFRWGH